MGSEEVLGTPVPGYPDLVKISTEPTLVVPNPKHSARTKARKQALDILFEAELRDRDLLTTLDEHIVAANPTVREFAREIVRGVDEHLASIDERIAQCTSDQWVVERMPRVDRNLARIAIWEIDHSEVADAAAIAEAVSLATEFSTDDSASYLNGLLATASKTKPASAPTKVETEQVEEFDESELEQD